MNILILGDAKNVHARHIFERLRQTGTNVEYLDTSYLKVAKLELKSRSLDISRPSW